MRHPAALQPAPERRVLAVDLIGGHPGSRHPGIQGPLQYDPGQLRLGPEPHLLGHPGGSTPRPILGPCLGQVQLPVDECPPPGAGVGQEHAELAVVDLAGGARVLALDPTEVVPFLRKPVSSTTSTACGSPRCSTT